ncbi:hypothetical protein IAG25_33240 [Caballeronia sp. EK]|uniref:hypothetical protein n=1 Tax=Caballeronia sp. EK TaxID=2767469 RepID=UPI001655C59B|nr:hypothetical protein [Caballeronia sp. EK]MBC8641693.1 hypothetical protein [Caballeronia sp. EK]
MSKTDPTALNSRHLSASARRVLAITLAAFGIGLLSHAAQAATIEELVAAQREVMRAEMAKKIADAKGDKTAATAPATSALPVPIAVAPAITEAKTPKESKPRNPVDDIRVNGIYSDARGVVTVDVSVGNSASFPLTKGRSIEGWSLADISEASVTFQHGKNGAKKVVYMAQPTVSAAAPTVVATAASQQPMFPTPMSLPPIGPTRPPVSQSN